MSDSTPLGEPLNGSTGTSPASSTSASPLSPFISSHSTTSSEATTADGELMMEVVKRSCSGSNSIMNADERRLHVLGSRTPEDGTDTPVAELNQRFTPSLYSFVLPESAMPFTIPKGKDVIIDAIPSSSHTASILSSVPSSPSFSLADADSGLTPPANFSLVVPGVYRSAFPSPANFAYLDTLGLKSVCVLVQEPYPPANEQWRISRGVRLLQFGIPGHKEAPMPPAVIEQALLAVLDKRNHPMLIHCNKGKHRTGCVVACLRRLQQWSTAKSIKEYCTFSHPKSRAADQAFVTAFDLERIQQSLATDGKDWLPDCFGDVVQREAIVEEVVGDLEDGDGA